MSDASELARKIEDLLRACEEQYPGNSAEKVVAFRTAAETYLRLRLPAKAVPIYERALAILKAIEAQPSAERLAILDALSTSYVACARHGDALASIAEAIAILEAHFPEHTDALIAAMNKLASTHLALGQHDRAEKIFVECLSLLQSVREPRKESIAATHHQLGALHFQKGDYLRAEQSFSLALALKKELFGDSHPQVGTTLHNLAAVYTVLGHSSAQGMAAEAQRMLATPPSPAPTAAPGAVRGASLRCLDPGHRATDLLGPLIADLVRAGFTVERVATVSERDIHEEGLLPPIVTIYFQEADLADAADLAPLAESLAGVVARFRTAGVTGIDGSPHHKPTNDAGVFVHWPASDATVRYYFAGESYTPSAFTAIPGTFAAVAPRIQRTGHALRNIVLWTDDHWRWLQPGGDCRVG